MKLSQQDVEHIIADVVKHGLSTKTVANQFKISRRRVQQLVKRFRDTGIVPILARSGRKPYACYPSDIKERVIELAKLYKSGATLIGRILRKKYGIKIGNNKVHAILLEANMAKEEKNKKKRKTPWVRY
ncbi:MAG: helix-turn-helix domain-containing protein, partial [Thermoplasmata archaeon]